MMEKISGLWGLIQGDPKFMRTVNGWLTILWIVMIPVAMIMGWLTSVTFVSALSLWALVSGHWSAWQAARVEVKQQMEENQDTEGKIAQRVIKESNLHHNGKRTTKTTTQTTQQTTAKSKKHRKNKS
jgi:uncharacterized protein involved in cysteine biosynthesis